MFNLNLELTKKQIITLLILLGLLFILPLILFLVKQRQEIRKRAAGTDEVNLFLNPSSGDKYQGETFSVNIELLKIVEREIVISGAEAVLDVDEKLIINSVSCGSSFDGLRIERIGDQKITLMCTINIATDPISLETEPILLGTISFSVKPDASLGDALVIFTDTRVTQAGIPGQAPDVSTSGEQATYTIVPASSPTVTPTATPVVTLTPTPSVSLTATPTPSPNCPKEAKAGDYNCDGEVNLQDFEAWQNDYLEGETTLPFFEYWRRAFFDQ